MLYDTRRADELLRYEEERVEAMDEDLTPSIRRSFSIEGRLHRSSRGAPHRITPRRRSHRAPEVFEGGPTYGPSLERSQEQRIELAQEIGEAALVEADAMQLFILSMPSWGPRRTYNRDPLNI